jgi:hypothetical protein
MAVLLPQENLRKYCHCHYHFHFHYHRDYLFQAGNNTPQGM